MVILFEESYELKVRPPQFHTDPCKKIIFVLKRLMTRESEHSELITLHLWQRTDYVKGNGWI